MKSKLSKLREKHTSSPGSTTFISPPRRVATGSESTTVHREWEREYELQRRKSDQIRVRMRRLRMGAKEECGVGGDGGAREKVEKG